MTKKHILNRCTDRPYCRRQIANPVYGTKRTATCRGCLEYFYVPTDIRTDAERGGGKFRYNLDWLFDADGKRINP